jgi:hypothetical protein
MARHSEFAPRVSGDPEEKGFSEATDVWSPCVR